MIVQSSSFPAATADSLLRAQYDRRSCIRKIIDFCISIFKQIRYSLTVLYHRLFVIKSQSSDQKIEWKSDSRGLVVLLHGLRNTSAAWYFQLKILQQHEKVDVYAPTVLKQGMCSLEEAVTPELPVLLEYIKKNPEKPVCILGVSNGSRMASWLEIKLREQAPKTPVMVSAIAGVILGSRRVDLLEELGLAKCVLPDVLCEELKYDSKVGQNLLNGLSAPLLTGCAERKYEFFASADDVIVPDLDSSLPTINKGEIFHVVHAESHDSIVAAVAKKQIASCVKWIGSFH